jgi:hypothetical protein
MTGKNQNAVLIVSMPKVNTPRACLKNDLTRYPESAAEVLHFSPKRPAARLAGTIRLE